MARRTSALLARGCIVRSARLLCRWPQIDSATTARLDSARLAGKISYGIFLWHVPVLVLVVKHRGSYDWLTFDPFVAKLLVTSSVTIACAAFSFYVVEKPFLRMKVPREQAHAAP